MHSEPAIPDQIRTRILYRTEEDCVGHRRASQNIENYNLNRHCSTAEGLAALHFSLAATARTNAFIHHYHYHLSPVE